MLLSALGSNVSRLHFLCEDILVLQLIVCGGEAMPLKALGEKQCERWLGQKVLCGKDSRLYVVRGWSVKIANGK